MSHTSEKNRKLRELRCLLDWNRSELARFLGVTPVTMHHWYEGTCSPSGINASLINIALAIGKLNPDVLEAARTMKIPANPYGTIVEFFGDDVGICYWFDMTADLFGKAHNNKTMGRVAVLLGLIGAFYPDMRARMVAAYPAAVRQRQQARIDKQQERDKANKSKLKRKRDERRTMREMYRSDENGSK